MKASAAIRCFEAGRGEDAAGLIAAGHAASALTVLFATADQDLGALGAELARRDVTRVIGAATGRIIASSGFKPRGLSGFHLPAARFACTQLLLEEVASISLPELKERARALRLKLESGSGARFEHRFALLFVDAETRCEERLAAVLGMELNGIPLIGGSAGDLYFNPHQQGRAAAPLLYGGTAHRGAAILCLVACADPVVAYCHNHYLRSAVKLVITDADPARRLVREMDGRPALEVYAQACGFRRPPRDGRDFAPYPLMIRIGGQDYPRGVQRLYTDANGSLEFACALERGLVVALGRPGNMVKSLDRLFAAICEQVGAPELVIGVDCAARTADMERKGLTPAIEALLRAHSVVGMSSLGEQFNTIHANNSFTCLAIGAAP